MPMNAGLAAVCLGAAAAAVALVPTSAGAVSIVLIPETGGGQFCDGCATSGRLGSDMAIGRSYHPYTGRPIDYVSAFEFALDAIPRTATITSAYLSIGVFRQETMGTVALATYFGDGVLDYSDLRTAYTPSLFLTDAATQLYDVREQLVGYHRIGATDFGFQAKQTPVGVCADPQPQIDPIYRHCIGFLTGPTRPEVTGRPLLFVDYTPFVEPPAAPPVDPPVDPGVAPEPATWALMIGGFGIAGAALRRRRGEGVACAR